MDDPNADEDLISPDNRRPVGILDSRRQADGELSDSDDEGLGGRRNRESFKQRRSRTPPTRNEGAPGRSGIMLANSSSSHAGPSAHTTAEKVLSSGLAVLEPEDVAMAPVEVSASRTEDTPMETS